MTHDLNLGDKVLVLTPTAHYWTGRIVGLTAMEIALDEAAWIAEIGRHWDYVATGKPTSNAEIEPHADGQITRVPRIGSTIIDWPWDLPRRQV